MGYSNFKDPFGLLKRMLLSGNKIAYSVLIREVLNKILIPVDFLLHRKEKRRLQKQRSISKDPIILVLGGSRSGTTLLYQTLAYYLPVGYISNFIAAFSRSPISALKLFGRFLPKPKKSFQSYYGSVSGMGGPNDAFSLWNRWLGDDRNHIPKEINEQSSADMKLFFNTWLHITKKPFLNKNNRNSLCAPLLDEILENVYFIEIHRDPIFVAQSLVLSRRAVQGTNKIGWGLLSQDSENTGDPLDYIDDICKQVYQVDQTLASGRKKIDPKKYLRVSYEDFCKQPQELIQKVAKNVLNYEIETESLKDLKLSTNTNSQRLNDAEFNRICNCIEKLYN
ncbi:sulfotransferase [Muriicola sp. Z0-33]|uniref:sulfotransferase n=1 Tax=Muriicola sp. Z0-33 TaxID=2816957 RepID=UPI00223883AA|nr:sulfotransferase [Muriicola sp. Z0-33]MCW5515658.1 sulfotransferase [Muriicola sp. Z0-33]